MKSLQQRLEESKRSGKEKDALTARLKKNVRQLEESAQKACREADEKEARREREYKMLQDVSENISLLSLTSKIPLFTGTLMKTIADKESEWVSEKEFCLCICFTFYNTDNDEGLCFVSAAAQRIWLSDEGARGNEGDRSFTGTETWYFGYLIRLKHVEPLSSMF